MQGIRWLLSDLGMFYAMLDHYEGHLASTVDYVLLPQSSLVEYR